MTTNDFNCFQAATALEDSQAGKHGLLILVEQIVTRVDGSLQCLVSGLEIARPCGEHPKRIAQQVKHIFGREYLHPGGCQFNRQGQAVQVDAQFSHMAGVDLGKPEVRVRGLGALDE